MGETFPAGPFVARLPKPTRWGQSPLESGPKMDEAFDTGAFWDGFSSTPFTWWKLMLKNVENVFVQWPERSKCQKTIRSKITKEVQYILIDRRRTTPLGSPPGLAESACAVSLVSQTKGLEVVKHPTLSCRSWPKLWVKIQMKTGRESQWFCGFPAASSFSFSANFTTALSSDHS